MDFSQWHQTTLECAGTVIGRLTQATDNPTLNNYCIAKLVSNTAELWKVNAARIQLEIDEISVSFAADGLAGISVACQYQYSSHRGPKLAAIAITAQELHTLFGDAGDALLADLAAEDTDNQSEE